VAGAPAGASAATPANDNFASAAAISSLPFSDSDDISLATTEPGEPNCGGIVQTVWYSFTPTSNEIVRVDLGGSTFFDTALSVFQASSPGFGGLAFVPGGCTNAFQNGSTVVFAAQAGTTYYVQAGSVFGDAGSLSVNLTVVPPPANDDFANARVITTLPFDDTVDATAATVESNEPHDSTCVGPPTATVWYAFTPSTSGSLTATLSNNSFVSLAAYAGTTLSNLSSVGCTNFGQDLTFHVSAGTTYYFQLVPLSPIGLGVMTFHLQVTPPPTAAFFFSPGDPSTFDTVQFVDQSFDPGQAGFSNEVWTFGDGTTLTNPGCCPTHRYAADGTYTVQLAVTTTDGRTASVSQDVLVKTHDVAITKVQVPQSARVSQTRAISVGLTDSRYPETVQVELQKSVAGGGWQQVGVLTQAVPIRSGNRTTNFDFSYTFTADDASLGKVSFQAIATIQGAHDAIPADNTFISLPTRVNG
jgi:PKD repeat protein